MYDKKIVSKERKMLDRSFLLIGLLLISSFFIFGCTTESNIQNSENASIKSSELQTTPVIQTNSLEGTCPKGKTTNCTGECPLFIDKDGDNYCDRS